MSITYAKNSCLVKMPPYVVIGGKIYNCVKIGNKLWMSENLQLLTENTITSIWPVPAGTDCYFDGENYWYRPMYFQPVLDDIYDDTGFRAPDEADFIDLLNNGSPEDFCATGEYWDNLGTNLKGMNFKRMGYWYTSQGRMLDVGVNQILYSKPTGSGYTSSGYNRTWSIQNGQIVSQRYYSDVELGWPVRLVKDLT